MESFYNHGRCQYLHTFHSKICNYSTLKLLLFGNNGIAKRFIKERGGENVFYILAL
jgi:hypothetical protein